MACTDSVSLFLNPKNGDGTFFCNAGTVIQAAECKTTHLHLVLSLKMNGALHLLSLYACIVRVIVTLPPLLQYLLLTKHDPRCACLVSSLSSDDEQPFLAHPIPHPFT